VNVSDNLRARAIHTQFGIVRKIAIVVIGVFALATVLMSFEEFRQLGAGILASAGLAGLVIGFAAQKTLGNLLAGIQIAITQPIRIDDVVVVEGEWGRIEEITLTYVVVRIWDLRRLVLPIGYFLEQPFQNWTRVSADVLGTVYLVVDYTVPVDEIRAQLERIVRESNLWDRKVCGVQVTGASEHGIEVRALVSAADSSKAWDLRCEVREKLIAFLQQNYPGSLPRVRAEIQGEGA
jgi:small-conductance mechanosensitive channel